MQIFTEILWWDYAPYINSPEPINTDLIINLLETIAVNKIMPFNDVPVSEMSFWNMIGQLEVLFPLY